MHIEYLSLTNFRNYARLETHLPAQKPLVLVGANAQGKTGLLEAIYYLSTSRSPHTNTDRQLIHWRMEEDEQPFARLCADVRGANGVLSRVEITLLLERAQGAATPAQALANARFRKVVRINGVDKRALDLIGLLNVVLFLPQDLVLVEGPPTERRRFINDTLTQLDRDYFQALETYERALPQRNALLRRIADRHAAPSELAYWDDLIVTHGSHLIAQRQRFLRELEVNAQQMHAELSGRREVLTLQYQPGFLPTFKNNGQLSFPLIGLDLHRELRADQIAPQFAEQLAREQRESIERGVTLSGPHRDELRMLLNDRDAGLFGSRGQARTTVLALKLAEWQWMRQHSGEQPILLLDEVVAELDSQRRADLLTRICATPAQTLLTTTEIDIFTSEFVRQAAVWQVHNGQIAAG
jgi:DNA replication and repair protein RecF